VTHEKQERNIHLAELVISIMPLKSEKCHIFRVEAAMWCRWTKVEAKNRREIAAAKVSFSRFVEWVAEAR
jgi:hypothetical protein